MFAYVMSEPIIVTSVYLMLCGVVIYYIFKHLIKGGILNSDGNEQSAERVLIKDRINLINKQINEAYDAKFYQHDKDTNRILSLKIENLRKEKEELEKKL